MKNLFKYGWWSKGYTTCWGTHCSLRIQNQLGYTNIIMRRNQIVVQLKETAERIVRDNVDKEKI
jgi:hypothetical protein